MDRSFSLPKTDQEFVIDDDQTISMAEIISEQESKCNEFSFVYGNDDLNVCSYDKGYVPCQGIHICLTCQKNEDEVAGVCSACSLTCHEGHDIIPISTRRLFRCDCGNAKFENNPCLLQPKKDNYNNKNIYNQNFRNRYCVCHCLYDYENDTKMYACVICEDWFHEEHIYPSPPDNPFDLVCYDCAFKFPFLSAYAYLPERDNCLNKCIIQSFIPSKTQTFIFLSPNWQKNICKCFKCFVIVFLIKEKLIETDLCWLLDEGVDPKSWYEEGYKNYSLRPEDIIQKLEKKDFSKAQLMVNRIYIQINKDYHYLEKELMQFLADFRSKSLVVKPTDIYEFFENLKNRYFHRNHNY